MKLVLSTLAILVAGSLLLADAAADTASDARTACAIAHDAGPGTRC